ncbi:MAG: signal peptidase complex subunit 2 [archaeon]|nr:signal peptidase complex subunit 2 [archaeon]
MSTTTPATKEEKNLPINKYSIYEIKSGIDQTISHFLEKKKFNEHFFLQNIKIVIGLFILCFTALAYFYPQPFPKNYSAIAIGVIGYVIFSLIEWYFENYILKTVFYCGSNSEYCEKLRLKKHLKIKEIRINSDIEEYSNIYKYFFEFITDEGKFKSEEYNITANSVIDERGYIVKSEVEKQFIDKFNKEISGLK